MQYVLAKHEMFKEIGGGETNKQGQEVESVSCKANNVGQFRQSLMEIACKDIDTTIKDVEQGTSFIVSQQRETSYYHSEN